MSSNDDDSAFTEEFNFTVKDEEISQPKTINVTTNIKFQHSNDYQMAFKEQPAVQMQSFRVTGNDQAGFIDTTRLLDLTFLFIEQLEAHKRRLVELNKFYKSVNHYLSRVPCEDLQNADDSIEANQAICRFMLESVCAQYVQSEHRESVIDGSNIFAKLIEDIACSPDTLLNIENKNDFKANCSNFKSLVRTPLIVNNSINASGVISTSRNTAQQLPTSLPPATTILNDQLRAQSKACQAMLKESRDDIPISPIKLYADELAFPTMTLLGDSEFLLCRLNDHDYYYGNNGSSKANDDYRQISELYGPYSHPNLVDLVRMEISDLHWNARYRVITGDQEYSNNTRSYVGNREKIRMYGLVNIKRKDSNEVLENKMVPCNPYKSPTNIRGRGNLPLWGPNYIFILFAWHWNIKLDQPQVILMRDPNIEDRIYSLPKGVPHFKSTEDEIVTQNSNIPPKLRDLWIEDIRRCSRLSSDSMTVSDEQMCYTLAQAMNFDSTNKYHNHTSAGYIIHPLNTDNAWVEAIVHYRCITGFEDILASPTPTGGIWDEAFFTHFPIIDCALALSTIDRQIIMQAIADKVVYRPNKTELT
ncbi:hypothetical protein GJ496_007422 [Pomphorhynchus laevis]|nr:hypothetical protein GJ496_000069 [Pomphorhynchus laevis]KAI0981782.1 hypothetical protein GJ496_007422 [Pomphorhynchus laevis]